MFVTEGLKACLEGKHVFLDNDFLTELLADENLFKEFIEKFSSCFLVLDPFTAFEFLRDAFLPEHREVREALLSKEVFYPTVNHQEVFIKIQGNALILSKIYSQHGQSKGCSTIDLFLAGRLMHVGESGVLVTGNKKDFPACIFDTVGVINVERLSDLSTKAFSAVSFNKSKFDTAYEKLQKLEARAKK